METLKVDLPLWKYVDTSESSLPDLVFLCTDKVKFGEVVQAPPRLSAKPRGSDKILRKTHKQELSKASSLLDLTTDMSKLSTGGLKRQKDIEEEREAVIKKYREMKKVKLRQD